MLRAAALAAVGIACTAIGLRMGAELLERVRSLRELERLMIMLKREIQYARAPLEEAFGEIAQRCAGPFSCFFAEAARAMELREGRSMEEIFRECAGVFEGTGLSGEDVEHFVRMGGRLGYLDGEMQVRTIQFYQEELTQERQDAEEEYRQRAKIYRYLGFLGGCFLILLLI